MFERFSDRARTTMALANKEAQRLNHEYIGTEHILLGIVREGTGVGANVLKNLDVDLRKVRIEVEKLLKSGPELVTMSKLPQMPRAKNVIEFAIEEARSFGHNYVGTEHLLLGLLRDADGIAGQVLMSFDLDVAKARREVLNLLGESMKSEADSAERLPPRRERAKPLRDYPLVHRYPTLKASYDRFTDRAREVLTLASQEAPRLNHEYIGTEHILLGMVIEGSGVGAKVLENFGVELSKVRLEVEKLIKSGPEIVTMGNFPQTPRAKQVIQYAIEEAVQLNHNYVGTEHLLLGLLREEDGVAAQVLINLDLDVAEVREEVLNLLGASMESDTVSEERLPARRKRKEPFSDHPLVQRYRAIKESYDRLKDAAVVAADYERAARIRDVGEGWVRRSRTLCQRLKKDPDFASSLPASVLKYCVEVAWDADECERTSELETTSDALLTGKTVLIIGAPDSGRDKFLGQATSAAFELGVNARRPPTRFFAPNHDLMLKRESDGGYAGALAALAKDMLATDACGFALRELHLYADPATFSQEVIKLWGRTLVDCAAKQRPIIATTSPDGATRLRESWPRLFDHTVEIRIE